MKGNKQEKAHRKPKLNLQGAYLQRYRVNEVTHSKASLRQKLHYRMASRKGC